MLNQFYIIFSLLSLPMQYNPPTERRPGRDQVQLRANCHVGEGVKLIIVGQEEYFLRVRNVFLLSSM